MGTFKWSRCFLCLSEDSEEVLVRKEEVVKAFETSCHYLIDKDEVRKGVLQLFEDDEGKTDGLEVVLCGSCGEVAESVQELHLELEEIRRRLLGRVKVLQDVVVRNSRLYGTNGRAKKSLEELEEWVEAQGKLGRSVEAEKRFLKFLHVFQTLVFEKDIGIPPPIQDTKESSDKEAKSLESLKDAIKVEMDPDDIHSEEMDECLDFNEAEVADEINLGDKILGKNKRAKNPKRTSRPARRISSTRSIASNTNVELAHTIEDTTSSCTKVHIIKKRQFEDQHFRNVANDKSFVKSAKLDRNKKKQLKHEKLLMSRFKCDLCPKKYARNSTLKDHKIQVHGIGIGMTHECDECHQKFSSNSALCTHRLSHREGKQHICDTCGYSTNYFHALKMHLQTHEGVLNYFCSHCPKAFSNLKQLHNHLRLHSDPGDKLECDLCDFVGLNRYSIYSHKKTMHGPPTQLPPDSEASNVKYECSTCYAKFTTKISFFKHLAAEHGEKPYVCKICDATFSYKTGLHIHRFKQHKDKHQEVNSLENFECLYCCKKLSTKTGLNLHIRRSHPKAKPQS